MIAKAKVIHPQIDPIQQSTALIAQYQAVRQISEQLCQPLENDDYGIQTMPDVSPPKWHLAHVTWFFEQFILVPFLKGYQCFHPQFHYLFNSYYYTAGNMHPRPKRGLLSRPTASEIFRYRHSVDEHMTHLLSNPSLLEHPEHNANLQQLTQMGIQHEQQHQELLLTDIKHIFATNPLKPVYSEPANLLKKTAKSIMALNPKTQWVHYKGGTIDVGATPDEGFCYDNETPCHRIYLPPYRLATHLVTNGEYLAFMAADGYQRVDLWLSDGWTTNQTEQWQAPLYWQQIDNQWWHMTLAGMCPVDEHAPVCHVSFFEADAYARWCGKTLPTEHAWEAATEQVPIAGNFQETRAFHPQPCTTKASSLQQMYGNVWEWTRSAYAPYPGFKPLSGTLGEYNGKFMCSQIVLRGGSCVTPQNHIRSTYRNFFYPQDRWQFSGIRLMEEQ